MLTTFLPSKSRSRNAKVRARRSTLESLETRQLLSGAKPTFNLLAISPTQVEISWNPVKNSTGYLVQEAVPGYKTVKVHGHKIIKPVTVWETLVKVSKGTTSYIVNGLCPSTPYIIDLASLRGRTQNQGNSRVVVTPCPVPPAPQPPAPQPPAPQPNPQPVPQPSPHPIPQPIPPPNPEPPTSPDAPDAPVFSITPFTSTWGPSVSVTLQASTRATDYGIMEQITDFNGPVKSTDCGGLNGTIWRLMNEVTPGGVGSMPGTTISTTGPWTESIYDLLPNTTYVFSVWAFNNAGETQQNNGLSVTTLS